MTVEKNIHFAIKNSATKSVKNQFAMNVKNETLNYLKFKTKNLVKKSITHFGIRANHIQFARNETDKNCIECIPKYIIEAPFRVTVHLSVFMGDNVGENRGLQWELDREEWEKIKSNALPWKIQLRPEFGMLLS